MDFWEFLQTLPGILIILFIGTGMLVTSIVGAWGKHWRELKLAAAAVELKTRMVERGMSADEIERVLRAENASHAAVEPEEEAAASEGSAVLALIENGTDGKGIVDVIAAGLPVAESPNAVARAMAETGYEGEDIARVIAAMKRAAPEEQPEARRQPPDIELEIREGAAAGV